MAAPAWFGAPSSPDSPHELFFPFRDAPNPETRPYVTWALIAVNVAVFLAFTLPLSAQGASLQDPGLEGIFARYPEIKEALGRGIDTGLTAYDGFVHTWGFVPARGGVATLFTSMFLHAGLMHLAGNMLFLWIYGDNVEARLGRVGFLIAYLATGVCASYGQALLDMDSTVPMVGASGAISGVLGFYFVFFPKNTVHVMVLLIPIFVRPIQVPARLALGFYLVVDNLLPFLTAARGGGGVAHGAHIGGFIAGLVGAYALGARGSTRNPNARVPRRSPARRDGQVTARTGASGSLSNLVTRGRMEEAAQRYFAADGRVELASKQALELAQWLAENGHPTASLQVFRRVIAQEPRGSLAAWAHVGAGYVQAHFRDQTTAAYQHYLDAIDLDPSGEAGARAREALARLER